MRFLHAEIDARTPSDFRNDGADVGDARRCRRRRSPAPTLIIHGDEDAIPMRMVSEWVTALPNARILRLRETGHFPHAERPAIVFPAIETFLRGKWPKGTVDE